MLLYGLFGRRWWIVYSAVFVIVVPNKAPESVVNSIMGSDSGICLKTPWQLLMVGDPFLVVTKTLLVSSILWIHALDFNVDVLPVPLLLPSIHLIYDVTVDHLLLLAAFPSLGFGVSGSLLTPDCDAVQYFGVSPVHGLPEEVQGGFSWIQLISWS